jgi:hypothetical protein
MLPPMTTMTITSDENNPTPSRFKKGDEGIIFYLTICNQTSIFCVIIYEANMKKLAALSLLLVLVSYATAQNWFKGTIDEALVKAKNDNKLVLINFFSSG